MSLCLLLSLLLFLRHELIVELFLFHIVLDETRFIDVDLLESLVVVVLDFLQQQLPELFLPVLVVQNLVELAID